MKKNVTHSRKTSKIPSFVLKAERAFRRAARNVETESRAHGLPVIVWKDGKIVEKAV
jgi:hypothetical protein